MPPVEGPAEDTLIHQDSELLPDRELYLRLARNGAFPSKKHGKKVVARWGDVKAALLGQNDAAVKTKRSDDDDLDDARRLLGLKEKAG